MKPTLSKFSISSFTYFAQLGFILYLCWTIGIAFFLRLILCWHNDGSTSFMFVGCQANMSLYLMSKFFSFALKSSASYELIRIVFGSSIPPRFSSLRSSSSTLALFFMSCSNCCQASNVACWYVLTRSSPALALLSNLVLHFSY